MHRSSPYPLASRLADGASTLRRVATIGLLAVAACLATAPAGAVTIDWVTVGDPGNASDETGYGAVNYDYQIGKYDVTIQQYTEFLNAVDPNGTNPFEVYNSSMQLILNSAGISFNAGHAVGAKYAVMNNGGDSSNRPITFVSWFDAARFANWMHNGQGSGSTETGAYTLVDGQTSGTAPARNPGAQFYIPTENEWYKAAYYSPVKGGVGSPGYYAYATQADSPPGNTVSGGANQANYAFNGVFSVSQSSSYSSSQNYLTDVGAFTNSASFYGTFDQSGNVQQWNDYEGTAGVTRGLRGGDWATGGAQGLTAFSRGGAQLYLEDSTVGFRLASPVATVPEPSTWAMAAGGLACAAWGTLRHRRRRSPL